MKKWKKQLPKVSDISIKVVEDWCKKYNTYDPKCQTIPEDHLYFYGDGFKNYSR